MQVAQKANQLSVDAGKMGCQEIKLLWSSNNQDQMLKTVNDLFDFLKNPDTQTVDLVHLKAYFSN